MSLGIALGISRHIHGLPGDHRPDGGLGQAPSITIDAPSQVRMGLTTQILSSGREAAQIDAFAKVLDPGPLVQLDSDLRTAEAAAAASKAEAHRSAALADAGGGIAAKDAEAAAAQARADALKVTVLRRQLGLGWGPGVARLSPGRARAAGARPGRRLIALVHVDTHNNEGQAGARSVRVDVGDGSVTARLIGPARAAEPRLQSSGLIVEVTGQSAMLLSVGLTQSAHIATTTPQTGVLIPRAAVIRFEGRTGSMSAPAPTGSSAG